MRQAWQEKLEVVAAAGAGTMAAATGAELSSARGLSLTACASACQPNRQTQPASSDLHSGTSIPTAVWEFSAYPLYSIENPRMGVLRSVSKAKVSRSEKVRQAIYNGKVLVNTAVDLDKLSRQFIIQFATVACLRT